VYAEPHRRSPDAALRIEQRGAGAAAVIAVHGELDLAEAPRLAARLDALREGGRSARVLVDLSDLQFCYSTGLRALLGAANEIRATGGRVAVVAPPAPVARVFEIAGAAEWLDIHPDADAALAALGAA
jgi:anti-anti-sigma factor